MVKPRLSYHLPRFFAHHYCKSQISINMEAQNLQLSVYLKLIINIIKHMFFIVEYQLVIDQDYSKQHT